MADLPTARWYIAELTEELIEGNPRNIVHRKTRVIFADSAEDAYQKALSMSAEAEAEDAYLSQEGDKSRTRYWSLKELDLLGEGSADSAATPVSPKRRPRPHYRQSDHLTPAQVAILMSYVPNDLPN